MKHPHSFRLKTDVGGWHLPVVLLCEDIFEINYIVDAIRNVQKNFVRKSFARFHALVIDLFMRANVLKNIPETIQKERRLPKTSSCISIKQGQKTPASDVTDTYTGETTASASALTDGSSYATTTSASDANITYSSLSASSPKQKRGNLNQSNRDGDPGKADEPGRMPDDADLTAAMRGLSLDAAPSRPASSRVPSWADPDDPYDRVQGRGPVKKKKVDACQKPAEPYRSTVYADDPGSPPLSRFSLNKRTTRGSVENVVSTPSEETNPSQYADRQELTDFPAPVPRRAGGAGPSSDVSSVVGGGDESLGAYGGSSRPATILDVVKAQSKDKFNSGLKGNPSNGRPKVIRAFLVIRLHCMASDGFLKSVSGS
ncbi:hypothetical protein Btru_043397 [Bulinus truncatus]|nr:hypothetical protein Btru_043397 [Bulinus truncatus]